MTNLPHEDKPMNITAAVSALAASYTRHWMHSQMIQNPGERWQALPTFETLMCSIEDDPEGFFDQLLQLQTIVKGAP